MHSSVVILHAVDDATDSVNLHQVPQQGPQPASTDKWIWLANDDRSREDLLAIQLNKLPDASEGKTCAPHVPLI
jgi:hypothetical protein